MIEKLGLIIDKNRQIKVYDVTEGVGMSSGVVENILYTRLCMKDCVSDAYSEWCTNVDDSSIYRYTAVKVVNSTRWKYGKKS